MSVASPSVDSWGSVRGHLYSRKYEKHHALLREVAKYSFIGGYQKAMNDMTTAVVFLGNDSSSTVENDSMDAYPRIKMDMMETLIKILSPEGETSFMNGGKLAMISHHYKVTDPITTQIILEQHSTLGVLIVDTAIRIKKAFGKDTELRLDVVSDPELAPEPFLFARILTDLPVEEAMAIIDQLDESWFLDNMMKAGGRFNYNVEWV